MRRRTRLCLERAKKEGERRPEQPFQRFRQLGTSRDSRDGPESLERSILNGGAEILHAVQLLSSAIAQLDNKLNRIPSEIVQRQIKKMKRER